MKILSFLEYQSKTNSTNIEDYLHYLEENLEELNNALIISQKSNLDKSICCDLQKSMHFVTGLIRLTENKFFSCISNTIDELSISELLPFHIGVKESDLTKRNQLENTMNQLKEKIVEEKKNYEIRLKEQGLNEELYQKKDTSLFFRELLPVSAYIDTLLLDNELSEETLRKKIGAITQMHKEEPFYSEELVHEIVSLLLDYHMVASKLTNKDNISFANSFLSNERILKFSSQEEIEKIFDSMQVLFKTETSFFKELPENIKITLLQENFKGDCYAKLKCNYENILNHRSISLPTREKIGTLEAAIQKIEKEIIGFDEQIEKHMAIRNDVSALREYVKAKFERVLMGDHTLETYKLQEICERKEKMDAICEEIQKENEAIIRLQEILKDSSYSYFFDTFSAKTLKRIFDAVSGVYATELVVKPYLDAEEKRYKQIEILYDGQKKLAQLETEIHALEAKKFATLSRKIKDKISELKEKYQKTSEECYNELKQQDLLIVETPEILYTSTFNNIEIAGRKNLYPHSFDDLSEITPILLDLTPSIPEIKTIGEYKEEVENYICDITTRHKRLFEKLFSYEKRGPNKFFYTFSITEQEVLELKECQEEIIQFVRIIYDNRREGRRQFESAAQAYLDPTKVNELVLLGISESNMTREGVEQTILQKKQKKKSLEEELSKMENLQLESKKYLPNEVSLENVMQYQQMLLGIDTCRVSIDKMKVYCFQK